ncbi:MAG TPA: GNAT family N-acetyltransferase [Pseudomonas sp.]|uniref:GNAT family N-acetyltransferase n=1 Tax=Pseudomonas sp. TaxID=306 RepID=UPI002C862AA5|nr:GNAT family N-acetyltransferase [Pseudomonas sp.]HSX89478.1 GNAT family N-acetyltransferase [Pseudomonas sp.]
MPDHSLHIRPATLDDLNCLQTLGHETYRDHFAALWSEQGLEAFLDQDFSHAALRQSLSQTQRHLWLIAFDDTEAAVGFAKINWSSAQPLSGTPGAELQKLYLRASATGRGWGEALMQAVEQQARLQGENSLWLEVLQSNHRAQRFYQRQGFNPVGDISFSTDLQTIGMRVMERRLECSYAQAQIDGAQAQGEQPHVPSNKL